MLSSIVGDGIVELIAEMENSYRSKPKQLTFRLLCTMKNYSYGIELNCNRSFLEIDFIKN